MAHRDTPATPAGTSLSESTMETLLGYRLAQASVVTARVFADRIGRVFDLRPVEFTVLMLVVENPGVSARRLADALAVTPPNITMWIDRLVARGLVERERSATDRRAQHIRPTPQGRTLALDAARSAREGEEATLAALSPAERAMLGELLGKVARCRARRG